MSDPFTQIYRELKELRRAMERMVRPVEVKEWDPDKNTVKVSVGDGDPVEARVASLSSGALKVRMTPSVGQAMLMICPNGDARQAVVIPGDWTGQNASPSNETSECHITRGNATFTLADGKIVLSVGDASLTVTAGGIETQGDIDLNGGYVKSDGKVIDHTHRHKDVVAGFDPTGVPV
ncbi:hypothetical protein [uncultured Cohaesibacter sp.]|uniref:hypothetical protein n=1 Tax=uncultured Cohaesibacter sp. TaxID=1002546 RepID=UPI002AAC15A9|nr:hypothetical protein [uncultured Cohaesibacter sp.]